jgi:hypothetical protein
MAGVALRGRENGSRVEERMRIGTILLGTAFVVGLTVPAAAQGSAPSQFFVGGLGGLTFGTQTSSAIGGQFGAKIATNLHVIGEIGRIQNVFPKEFSDFIDEFEALAEAEFGIPVEIEIQVPALYGFGGARWSQPQGRLTPFVEGGVGFARLTGKVKVAGLNIDDFVPADLLDQTTTEPLIAFGGGVNVEVTRKMSVDAGYRYSRIFTEDPAVNASMIYGAVKIFFGR